MRRKKREQPNDGARGRRDDEARFESIERERADEAVERPTRDDDFVTDAEIEAREERSGTKDEE